MSLLLPTPVQHSGRAASDPAGDAAGGDKPADGAATDGAGATQAQAQTPPSVQPSALSQAQYSAAGAQVRGFNGCFSFRLLPSDAAVDLREEYNATAGCVTSVYVTPRPLFADGGAGQHIARGAASASADDIAADYGGMGSSREVSRLVARASGPVKEGSPTAAAAVGELQCSILTARINSLRINHHTLKVHVGETTSLYVEGFDDAGNTFSSLEGMKFFWSIDPLPGPTEAAGGGVKPLQNVPLYDTGYGSASSVRINLEEQGYGADIHMIRGNHVGQATVTASLLGHVQPSGPAVARGTERTEERGSKRLLSATVTITVSESAVIVPSMSVVRLLPQSVCPLALRFMTAGTDPERHARYRWGQLPRRGGEAAAAPEGVTVHPATGVVRALAPGARRDVVFAEDTRLPAGEQREMIEVQVCAPASIQLVVIPRAELSQLVAHADAAINYNAGARGTVADAMDAAGPGEPFDFESFHGASMSADDVYVTLDEGYALIPVIRDEAGKRIFVTNSTAVDVRPADAGKKGEGAIWRSRDDEGEKDADGDTQHRLELVGIGGTRTIVTTKPGVESLLLDVEWYRPTPGDVSGTLERQRLSNSATLHVCSPVRLPVPSPCGTSTDRRACFSPIGDGVVHLPASGRVLAAEGRTRHVSQTYQFRPSGGCGDGRVSQARFLYEIAGSGTSVGRPASTITSSGVLSLVTDADSHPSAQATTLAVIVASSHDLRHGHNAMTATILGTAPARAVAASGGVGLGKHRGSHNEVHVVEGKHALLYFILLNADGKPYTQCDAFHEHTSWSSSSDGDSGKGRAVSLEKADAQADGGAVGSAAWPGAACSVARVSLGDAPQTVVTASLRTAGSGRDTDMGTGSSHLSASWSIRQFMPFTFSAPRCSSCKALLLAVGSTILVRVEGGPPRTGTTADPWDFLDVVRAPGDGGGGGGGGGPPGLRVSRFMPSSSAAVLLSFECEDFGVFDATIGVRSKLPQGAGVAGAVETSSTVRVTCDFPRRVLPFFSDKADQPSGVRFEHDAEGYLPHSLSGRGQSIVDVAAYDVKVVGLDDADAVFDSINNLALNFTSSDTSLLSFARGCADPRSSGGRRSPMECSVGSIVDMASAVTAGARERSLFVDVRATDVFMLRGDGRGADGDEEEKARRERAENLRVRLRGEIGRLKHRLPVTVVPRIWIGAADEAHSDEGDGRRDPPTILVYSGAGTHRDLPVRGGSKSIHVSGGGPSAVATFDVVLGATAAGPEEKGEKRMVVSPVGLGAGRFQIVDGETGQLLPIIAKVSDVHAVRLRASAAAEASGAPDVPTGASPRNQIGMELGSEGSVAVSVLDEEGSAFHASQLPLMNVHLEIVGESVVRLGADSLVTGPSTRIAASSLGDSSMVASVATGPSAGALVVSNVLKVSVHDSFSIVPRRLRLNIAVGAAYVLTTAGGPLASESNVVVFSSADESIASVDAHGGCLRGLRVGEVSVVARMLRRGKDQDEAEEVLISASILVNVVAVASVDVVLPQNVEEGRTVFASVQGNGGELDTFSVAQVCHTYEWTASDEKVSLLPHPAGAPSRGAPRGRGGTDPRHQGAPGGCGPDASVDGGFSVDVTGVTAGTVTLSVRMICRTVRVVREGAGALDGEGERDIEFHGHAVLAVIQKPSLVLPDDAVWMLPPMHRTRAGTLNTGDRRRGVYSATTVGGVTSPAMALSSGDALRPEDSRQARRSSAAAKTKVVSVEADGSLQTGSALGISCIQQSTDVVAAVVKVSKPAALVVGASVGGRIHQISVRVGSTVAIPIVMLDVLGVPFALPHLLLDASVETHRLDMIEPQIVHGVGGSAGTSSAASSQDDQTYVSVRGVRRGRALIRVQVKKYKVDRYVIVRVQAEDEADADAPERRGAEAREENAEDVGDGPTSAANGTSTREAGAGGADEQSSVPERPDALASPPSADGATDGWSRSGIVASSRHGSFEAFAREFAASLSSGENFAVSVIVAAAVGLILIVALFARGSSGVGGGGRFAEAAGRHAEEGNTNVYTTPKRTAGPHTPRRPLVTPGSDAHNKTPPGVFSHSPRSPFQAPLASEQ